MESFLTQSIIFGILAAGVRLATPFLLAALGEMFVQRSGVYNLGIEGIMLLGAFLGFFATLHLGNPFFGILAGIGTGAVLGFLMALVSVTFKAEQGISGIGLYMFGWGLSGLLFRLYVGGITSIKGLQPLRIPLLCDVPCLGPIFFRHNWIVYLVYLLVPFAWFVLNRTTWGLKVR